MPGFLLFLFTMELGSTRMRGSFSWEGLKLVFASDTYSFSSSNPLHIAYLPLNIYVVPRMTAEYVFSEFYISQMAIL